MGEMKNVAGPEENQLKNCKTVFFVCSCKTFTSQDPLWQLTVTSETHIFSVISPLQHFPIMKLSPHVQLLSGCQCWQIRSFHFFHVFQSCSSRLTTTPTRRANTSSWSSPCWRLPTWPTWREWWVRLLFGNIFLHHRVFLAQVPWNENAFNFLAQHGPSGRESMKDSHSVGTGCCKLSEHVSQQMVFLLVCCWIDCSPGHSSQDLNCFLYPQLPFITLAAGYFTLSGGLKLTGSVPGRFMLGGQGGGGRWNGRDLSRGAQRELTAVQPRVCWSLCGLSPSCKGRRDTPQSNLRCVLLGDWSRRLSSFIVVPHKDSDTMDAADLSDNEWAGSEKNQTVFAHCVFKAACC